MAVMPSFPPGLHDDHHLPALYVFLNGDLPRCAPGHLHVLCVCDRHRDRAGTDCGVRIPLPAPAEPADPALRPQDPVQKTHPGHRPPRPSPLLHGSHLLPLLCPLGKILLCYLGWRAVVQSWLTAASTSRAQAILSPQPPESQGLQSYLLMATVILLPYISKAAGWCRDRLLGHREPLAYPVEVFTFDLHEPLSKERVEAFSDGVYAIVATLLILDICEDNVPDPKDVKERFGGSLVAALSVFGPRFLAYFGSFATVALLWFAHHSLFLHVRKATQAMGLLNTFSLAFVGGLPLAYQQTSAFARQPHDELERVRVSCAIIFLASIFQLAIWTTALLHQADTLQPSVWFGGREHVLMFAKLALYPCASLLAFASTCLLSRFSAGIFHLTQIAVPCAFLLLRLLVGLALTSLRVLRGLAQPQRSPLAPTGQDDPQAQLLPSAC
nr:endosomal/lysosomal proton channel TMEM175 isoform X6 [Callithrix jacchus]